MSYEITPYSFVYFVAALICATAVPFAWKRRHRAPGAFWLTLMLLGMVEWTIADAMENSVTGLSQHILWSQISYLGGTMVPVLMLLFAVEYTLGNRYLPRWSIPLLFVVPVLIIFAAWTNEWHHLIWTDFTPTGDAHLINYIHGPLYWLMTAYAFGIMLVTTIILDGFAVKNWNLYRYQSAGIILAVMIPWTGFIIYDFAPGLLPGLEPSVTFSLSALVLTVSMLRFRLLDLLPVASESLVKEMSDGLLVLDERGIIVNCNPAFRNLFQLPPDGLIGQPIDEALAAWPEVVRPLLDSRELDKEKDFTLGLTGSRHINLRISPLMDKTGRHTGNLGVLRDISTLIQTQAQLRSTAADLQDRLTEIEGLQAELREQAIRDPLTTAYNRRYLSETLEREFGRAVREQYPISLVMLDIDYFKKINDNHGHAAGDLILRMLGEKLRAQTRPGDFVCRFGGDEFLLVLPNTPQDDAARRAELWRVDCEQSSIPLMDKLIDFTVSIGVATYPQNGSDSSQVLTAADDAVYMAKAASRNRVVISPQSIESAA